MNKILLGSATNYQKEGIYKLELTEDKIINLNGSDIKLYIFSKEDINVTINVKNKVEVYNFTTKNNNIDINLEDEADINFYQMTITDNNIINKISAYHKNLKTKSNLITRGISYKEGNLKFIINGTIPKGCVKATCNQSTRVINLDEAKSTIEPNLYIEEYDSVANHSSFTGPFDDKTLFYLQTKGISKEESFSLLLNAFFKVKDIETDYEKVINKYLKDLLRR